MSIKATRWREYVADRNPTRRRRRVRKSRRKVRVERLPAWFNLRAFIPRPLEVGRAPTNWPKIAGIPFDVVPDPLGDISPEADLSPPEGLPAAVTRFPALVARLNDAIGGYRPFASPADVVAERAAHEAVKASLRDLERFLKAGLRLSDGLRALPGEHPLQFIGKDRVARLLATLDEETAALRISCETFDSVHSLSSRRKFLLEREVAFLLSVYGIPLTVGNRGPFARTLEVVVRESHLGHLLSMGTPDFRKIIRREKERWTPEAVEKERLERAQK